MKVIVVALMIHLSKTALKEVSRLKAKQNNPDAVFRVGIGAGSCASFGYTLQFDSSVGAEDTVFESNGLRVVVDRASLNYLDGLTIDYSEDLMGGAFRFHNPNATATCGCSNAFEVERDRANSV
ncbi:HesB/IscA family protein [Oxynema aestuarii]|nr:iron-sulfur cluster assembly accessory protein [Oxynema aestuarii]